MSLLRLSAIAMASAVLAMSALPAASQQSGQTGTRIKGGESDQPTTIIRFDEPGELREIRRLLERGEIAPARTLADQLLAGDKTPSMRYAALNAKCAIETRAGQFDAAIEACDKAIAIRPLYWMALNSRGTAHLLAGRPEAALRDYETALRSVSEDSTTAEVIRHNIALAQQRLSGTS